MDSPGRPATGSEGSGRMSRTNDPLEPLRRLCLALPGAHEVEARGEPTGGWVGIGLDNGMDWTEVG
jgi:hypothetical protein